MALCGDISTDFGVNANYHIIYGFKWSKFSACEILVASYLSHEARNSLASPLMISSYFTSEEFSGYQPTVIELYDVLKSMDKFSQMQDL